MRLGDIFTGVPFQGGSMTGIRKSHKTRFWGLAGVLALGCGMAWAQIPNAPAVPTCGWVFDSTGQRLSNCKFKDAISGTPTSIVGNRVVWFDRTVTGGHGSSRQFLRDALNRLVARYGFNLLGPIPRSLLRL